MRVQAVKRAVLLGEWASQINERVQSGQSVRKWCAEQGVNEKPYYFHLKRVREEALEEARGRNAFAVAQRPVFAAVDVPRESNASVTVRIGTHTVEIHNGADVGTVERVLEVLSRL